MAYLLSLLFLHLPELFNDSCARENFLRWLHLKKTMMEIIESGENYEIVEEDGEKIYRLKFPPLTPADRKFLKDVENRAIGEINVNLEAVTDTVTKKKALEQDVYKLMLGELEAFKSGLKKREGFTIPDKEKLNAMKEMILNDMAGYGEIDPLLQDDNLEEVMVIGVNAPVYVAHRKYGTIPTNVVFTDDEDIRRIIEKIGRFTGRKVDMANPLLDARLPNGDRVNATLKPASLDGSTITIRKFKAEALTIINILKFGTLSPELAAFLWIAVEGLKVKPSNILVSGGTGSGKTTTLNCLGSFIPKYDRVITIEDTAELQLPLKHLIRLETKPPNIEGKGGLTFNQLLINTLRMRPDRLILGEVRGEEASTLFVAMNTGHDGCMGTCHANTANETITRLINPPMNVPLIMIPALDLIIMQNRIAAEGKIRRRITEVAEVAGIEGDKVLLNRIYDYDPKNDRVKPTGTPSRLMQEICKRAGISGEELNIEMQKRQIVLEYMMSKDITRLDEVSKWIQDYYKNPEEVLDRIQKSASA
jgi:flagellar protein FlaI